MRFERLNGTLRRLFGRLRIDAGAVGGNSSDTGLDLRQTWNTTGAPTAVKVNITDTASASGSLLMDLRAGGASKFSVDKAGKVIIAGEYIDEALDKAEISVASDTTDIAGADRITNIISLTQAEYDAITPNSSTLYIVIG